MACCPAAREKKSFHTRKPRYQQSSPSKGESSRSPPLHMLGQVHRVVALAQQRSPRKVSKMHRSTAAFQSHP